jgi:23S rRNA pseudouridine955/2504/2580 synthase
MRAVLTIPVADKDGESRLDRWLKRRFPALKQSQIEKLCRTGQVRVDGGRAKASDRVRPGQFVRVPPFEAHADQPRPGVAKLSAQDRALIERITLYEDDDILVLNKPFGVATQGGSRTQRHIDGLLLGLTGPDGERPRLVHRLDRDTTGVLVTAKTPAAAAALAAAFRTRKTLKIYWAVTAGVPKPLVGEIRGWLKKDQGPNASDREQVRTARHGEKDALFAITDYAVIANAAQRAAWVALKPVTGRTHQLRFHMAESGAAIVGDPKYKAAAPTPPGLEKCLHLHARAIEFPHPSTGKAVRIIAELPEHMVHAFDHLGFDESDARDPFEGFRR